MKTLIFFLGAGLVISLSHNVGMLEKHNILQYQLLEVKADKSENWMIRRHNSHLVEMVKEQRACEI